LELVAAAKEVLDNTDNLVKIPICNLLNNNSMTLMIEIDSNQLSALHTCLIAARVAPFSCKR
jgi:hypothetical protein